MGLTNDVAAHLTDSHQPPAMSLDGGSSETPYYSDSPLSLQGADWERQASRKMNESEIKEERVVFLVSYLACLSFVYKAEQKVYIEKYKELPRTLPQEGVLPEILL